MTSKANEFLSTEATQREEISCYNKVGAGGELHELLNNDAENSER